MEQVMMRAMKKTVNTAVIYNRTEEKEISWVQFKPGKEPCCKLGDETLNGQVNWLKTVKEVLGTQKFTLSSLSQHLDIKKEALEKVLDNDVSSLNFKAGAKLLNVYESLVMR
jgi:hypothetical protein